MFETSAKLGTNIDTAVLSLMREVLHHRQFAVQEKDDAGKEDGRYRTTPQRENATTLCIEVDWA